MTTEVPPLEGPEIGDVPVIVGGPGLPVAYVNRSLVPVGLLPAGVVTTTCTWPAAPAGAVTVMDAALKAVTAPVLAPKATVGVPGVKLVPVIVTMVPPPVEPVAGPIEVTAGAAWT